MAALRAANARALYRLELVEAVLQAVGVHDGGLPQAAPSTVYQELIRAFGDGRLEGEPPPRNTFLRWWNRALSALRQGSPVTAAVLADQSRPGRPVVEVDPWLGREVERLWVTGQYLKPVELYRALAPKALRQVPPVAMPGIDVVKRLIAEIDPEKVSAGWHGRRAADRDHGVRSTILAEYPHDVWTIDEAELPIYIRAFDPARNATVGVKPHVTLLMDHFSRVVLGWHITPPYGEAGDGVGVRDSQKVKGVDVLGVVWSAAIPELAGRSTRPYAGHLPRQFRNDNISTHAPVRTLLRTAKVVVPKLPPYEPMRRGDVEALVGTIKERMAGLFGSSSLYFVAEAVDEHPGRLRGRNTDGRTSARTPIAIADLMSLSELRERFEEIVIAYNHTPHSGLGPGLTPHQVYHGSLLPRSAYRDGRDLLAAATLHSVTMRSEGVVVRGARYRTVLASDLPSNGTVMQVVVDPLQRGAFWVTAPGGPRFLLTMADAAREPGIIDSMIATRHAVAVASEEAQTIREELVTEMTGDPGVVPRGAEALDEALAAAVKAKKRNAKSSTLFPKEAAEVERRTAARKAEREQHVVEQVPVPPVVPRFPGFQVGAR